MIAREADLKSICENLLWTLDRMYITSADENEYNYVDTDDLYRYWSEECFPQDT